MLLNYFLPRNKQISIGLNASVVRIGLPRLPYLGDGTGLARPKAQVTSPAPFVHTCLPPDAPFVHLRFG
jgi:hypothetical protein